MKNFFSKLYRFSIIALRVPFIQIFYRHQNKRSPLGFPLDKDQRPILWMTYPLVDFLNSIDFSSSNVFEYGSGGSTLWWASRVKKIISIEYNQKWLKTIQPLAPANATIIHHPITPNYSKTILNEKEKFDVIVIDGAHRFSCAKDSTRNLSEEGIVILDNTEWHMNTAKNLRDQGFLQIDFAGFCPLNSFPSVSSVFFRPNAKSILANRNNNSIIPPGGKAHPEGICYDDLN